MTPPDMLLTLRAAVNRLSRNGTSVGPEQRITIRKALRAVTCDAAYQYRDEDSKGQIRERMHADLVILSADPLATDSLGLREVEVLETIKGCEVVFRA